MCVIIVSLVTNSWALFSRWEIILLAMSGKPILKEVTIYSYILF